MIGISFRKWTSMAGNMLISNRVFTNRGKWTPIIIMKFRNIATRIRTDRDILIEILSHLHHENYPGNKLKKNILNNLEILLAETSKNKDFRSCVNRQIKHLDKKMDDILKLVQPPECDENYEYEDGEEKQKDKDTPMPIIQYGEKLPDGSRLMTAIPGHLREGEWKIDETKQAYTTFCEFTHRTPPETSNEEL